MTDQELLDDFLETTSYDEERDWTALPELGLEDDGDALTAAEDAGHPFHGNQWTGTSAPDLGVHDLPTFDETNERSPEWRTILKHDQFLDDLGTSHERDQVNEREALDTYVHDSDPVNAALRANPDLVDEVHDRPGQRTPKLAHIAFEVENAIADAPKIQNPVTVYRGLRGVSVTDLAKTPTLTLNGFQSTSFDPRVAASFIGAKSGGLTTGRDLNGVLLQITAKYGLAFGHAHSIAGEMEMLLPHGDSYDVLGVSQVRYKGGTFPMVHLRQR